MGDALPAKQSSLACGRRVLPLVLCVLLTLHGCGYQGEKTQAEKAYRLKYAAAKALFEERCKKAGVVISRAVKDVEGIELVKVRPKLDWADRRYFDPMFDEAAMAAEVRGDDYIKQFLMSEFRYVYRPDARGELRRPEAPPGHQQLKAIYGYKFVETVDPRNGERVRISLPWEPHQSNWNGSLVREPARQADTRYALDYEDLVDSADREHWVAGTKLKVIDKQTGEVMAMLTRFVWDPSFGTSTTGRRPWVHANTAASTRCPSDAAQSLGRDSRYFVDTVLVPKQMY